MEACQNLNVEGMGVIRSTDPPGCSHDHYPNSTKRFHAIMEDFLLNCAYARWNMTDESSTLHGYGVRL